MLLPNGLLCCPFTCVDASGFPQVPATTPTAILVKNGIDSAVSVAVSMTGASGVASCSIPANANPGDCWHLRISSSGYTQTSPVYLTGPAVLTAAYDAAKSAAAPGAAMTLTSSERIAFAGVIEAELLNDQTGGEFLAGIQSRIQAILDSNTDVPVVTLAGAIAHAVRENLAAELAKIDAPVSSRLAADDYTPPPPAEELAGALLREPSNKLLTTANGQVLTANSASGGGVSFVLPLRSTAVDRLVQNRIDLFTRERATLSIPIYDENRQPVDCTGMECTFRTSEGLEITGLIPTPTVPGGVPHQYQFTPPADLTATPVSTRYSLRLSNSSQQVIAYGQLVITETP